MGIRKEIEIVRLRLVLMNIRENFLRAAEMNGPEWIPCNVVISPPVWSKYRERMEDLVLRHPRIFGEYKKGSVRFDDFGVRRAGNRIVDEWGCVWTFLVDGLQGQVVEHPLEDWKALETYKPPDPLALENLPKEGFPPSPGDFKEALRELEKNKREGKLAVGSCPHGFMFQRLYYLRGFNNLMRDFITEPPQLKTLIRMVVEFNLKIIRRWLEVGIDLLSVGDDLGTQDRLPIPPSKFRKFLFPAYKEMFTPVRERGVHIHFHSDGHIMEIVDDLIEAGVTIINLQDLVNGVETIKKRLKGRVCVDVDIDRQRIVPFGRPSEVERHVKHVISELRSPEGGLMVTVGIYPPTPIENIEALCRALEEMGCGPKF
ncbi:hypothetical protein B6U84_06650 [Candidatus Bathyarchaeota archaeon ex4484_40]|nr:MAG: hypothetical protein B6U84_06650 [Candidatus Bathyarchaeota archaeon ex4484_40]